MNLKHINSETLMERIKNLVIDERKLTTEILHYLREIERRRLFAELGFTSLFEFAIKQLGYTEAQAQRRISAMRVIKELPEVEEKIKTGELSLSNVAQARTFFKLQEKQLRPLSVIEKSEVLKSLENKSTREAQKELVKLNPEIIPAEKLRVISENKTEVRFVMNQGLEQKLEQVRAQLSHKNNKYSMAELVEVMADIVLAKTSKTQRSVSVAREVGTQAGVNQPPPSVGAIPDGPPRPSVPGLRGKSTDLRKLSSRYIPIEIKRQVWMRDKACCSFVSSAGQACKSKHFLQIDHVRPFSLGGEATLENLRLLCRTHNQFMAVKILGERTMAKYIKQ